MTTAIQSPVVRILVTYALGVMAAMTVSEAVTELGAIAREFHIVDHSKPGLIMSLPSLMVALGALLAGYIVDRVGDRIVLLIGAVIIIAGDMFVISASTFNWLLIGRMLTGVGYVLAAVSAVTLLIRITTGKQRTMAMALWSTFVPVSFLLPFLSAGLAEHFGSWRAAFIAHSALTLALLVIAAFSLPARTALEKAQFSRTRGLSAVLKSPLPWLLGISFGADAFLQTGMSATLTPYLSRVYSVPPVDVAHMNVFAMLLNAVGCLSVGALLNRGVKAWVIAAFGVVMTGIAGIAIFTLHPSFMFSIAASWLFMFASGLLVGMWALAPLVAPTRESIGATSGLITQLTLVGVFLGPPLFISGQLHGNSHTMPTLIIAGLVVCLAGIPIWIRDVNRQALPGVNAADSGAAKSHS